MLSEELRKLRTRKKMTQKDVAERLGVDRTTYTSYETGKVEPSLPTMKKLAAIFEVPFSQMMALDNFPEFGRYSDALLASGEGLFEMNMEEEFALLMCYRALTAEGKRKAFDYIRSLPKRPELTRKNSYGRSEEAHPDDSEDKG